MRVISVLNQKGGVGKTTTALNLGHALALAGCSVLMADPDPQAHLTASWGIHGNDDDGIGNVLLGQTTIEESRVNVRERLDIVPAGSRLIEFEQTARDGAQQGQRLRLAQDVRERLESPSFGQSIFEYRPNDHGAEDYQALCTAVLDQSPAGMG